MYIVFSCKVHGNIVIQKYITKPTEDLVLWYFSNSTRRDFTGFIAVTSKNNKFNGGNYKINYSEGSI